MESNEIMGDPWTFSITERVLGVAVMSLLSLCGGAAAYLFIPRASDTFIAAGFSGKDLCKKNKTLVPESMGLISGGVFFIVMIAFIGLRFGGSHIGEGSPFPHELVGKLQTALFCMLAMLSLGFIDDALNLRWRWKLVLPLVATLPVLISHYISYGSTTVAVPMFLQPYLGTSKNIGVLYYMYMLMLALFSTNAINIYAGINGLEVGQSLVIAASIIVFNMIEMVGYLADAHHLSIVILLPFIATSTALFLHNRYPARVFVGDTFTYFAGMTFAVVGILGHFGKTVLLFFIPQVANFLYSIPQLFHVLPCPRHRLPQYNPDRNVLEYSRASIRESSVHPAVLRILQLLATLRLVALTRTPADSKFDDEPSITFNNLTLINLVLVWFGPMHESTLTWTLLGLQVLCSALAFIIRYPIAGLLYGHIQYTQFYWYQKLFM